MYDIYIRTYLIKENHRPQRKLIAENILQDFELDSQLSKVEAVNYYATQISMRTSGYVALDLKRLCKRALLKSLRRNRLESDDLAGELAQLSLVPEIEWSDFEYALSTYRPSQQIEVEASLPKRDWKEIGGYKIKQKITQATLLPLLQPEIFTRLGVKPPSGLLLYGPSGCGKTAMVQALASESMMNVISIKGPEIFSKYLGETESKVRKLFATAKRIAPCIMFIDEMDAIGTRRGWDTSDSGGGVNERVLSTLLNEMDGVEGRQGVIVIGCTNRPDQIDDAILRPGRLDQLIYVGLPTMEERLDIVMILSKKMVVSPTVDLQSLAQQTEYCNGADLENMFREAGILALRQDLNANAIEDKHLQQILETVCKRAKHQVLEQDSLAIYEKFRNDHSV
ncbi:P-loop containing nucleoside triphosphate hydrolase protein [Phycomyces blakesleeanus]